MSPRKAEFAPNLFNTYIAYKLSRGCIQADLIREFNAVLNKSYTGTSFYRWKTCSKSLPDGVTNTFILPILPELYRWYLKDKGVAVDTIDFDALSAAFSPAIKKDI